MFTAPHEHFCDPPAKRSTSPRHSWSCRPPMRAQQPCSNSYDVGQKLASLSPRAPSSIGYCFLGHQPGTSADSCLKNFINRKQKAIMAELINISVLVRSWERFKHFFYYYSENVYLCDLTLKTPPYKLASGDLATLLWCSPTQLVG